LEAYERDKEVEDGDKCTNQKTLIHFSHSPSFGNHHQPLHLSALENPKVVLEEMARMPMPQTLL
jgi:hypothetical protein